MRETMVDIKKKKEIKKNAEGHVDVSLEVIK
jgi:hypothetical protein